LNWSTSLFILCLYMRGNDMLIIENKGLCEKKRWNMPFRCRISCCLLVGCILLIMAVAVSCGGGDTTPAASGEALSSEESAYLELWQEAAVALIDFSMVELDALTAEPDEEPALTEIAGTYQDRRDDFEAALLDLEQASVPSSLAGYHTQLVPLYREALDNMDSMIDAASQNDEASFLEAKAGLIDTIDKAAAVTQ